MSSDTVAPFAAPAWRWKTVLSVLGPGVVVMLADTEVGSIVTAAQSGARWGYQLLLLQFLLIPVLYVVQELTVRLGLSTGKGHAELIRETFGTGWAWVSVGGLAVACLGALVTEFSGVAAVGELFGVPRTWSLSLATAALLAVTMTGSYRRVERVALTLGAFEFVFFLGAVAANPDGRAMVSGLAHAPVGNPSYLYLVAANIGAVIMPWMIFYQQSAVVDKRLRPEHYAAARWDTAIGAVVTQLVMAAVLVTAAATIGHRHPKGSLDTIGEVTQAIAPVLGERLGRAVFGIGVLGAGLVAAIVVSLAVAWGVGEATGCKHSLELGFSEAPWFYAIFDLVVIAGAILVAVAPNLVTLSVGIEVMNALLLPVVLGFLVVLALRALPGPHGVHGPYRWVVVGVAVLTAGLGVCFGLAGVLGS
jgi:NRAMP (natural resistance-associated macrophage protein)-like metal ion transporter